MEVKFHGLWLTFQGKGNQSLREEIMHLLEEHEVELESNHSTASRLVRFGGFVHRFIRVNAFGVGGGSGELQKRQNLR